MPKPIETGVDHRKTLHLKLWRAAKTLNIFGVVALLSTIALIDYSVDGEAEIPEWCELLANLACLPFIPGLLIFWYIGGRFYFNVHSRLGVTRGFIYLTILIGFGYLSPFIFMFLEGKQGFFDEAFS